MDKHKAQTIINQAFEDFSSLAHNEIEQAVDFALLGLDQGSLRVAEKNKEDWQTHEWLKKAILFIFSPQT